LKARVSEKKPGTGPALKTIKPWPVPGFSGFSQADERAIIDYQRQRQRHTAALFCDNGIVCQSVGNHNHVLVFRDRCHPRGVAIGRLTTTCQPLEEVFYVHQ
jgi:hypothetical protein